MGGRRWAKFARSLAQRGYRVHVIAARNPFRAEVSNWLPDVQHPNIIMHELPLRYPRVLITFPHNVWSKLAYRASLLFMRLFTRGAIFDRSVFWKRVMLRKAYELIREHSIRNVIATGAPFHLLHHSLDIRKIFPAVNLIADLRDPWTENIVYGMADLDPGRKAYEEKLEIEVLSGASHVVTPGTRFTEHLHSKCPGSQARFTTILNGVDPQDIASFQHAPAKAPDGRIRMIYAGTLYEDIDYVFHPFLDAIAEIKKASPALYDKLNIDIYTNAPAFRAACERRELSCIRFYAPLPVKEIYRKISDADLCIVFFNKYFNLPYTSNLTTKVTEYIYLRKPVLVFSNGGEIPSFIENNGIGFSLTPQDMGVKLKGILEDHQAGRMQFNNSFDTGIFDLDRLTSQLEQLFI